MELPTQPTSVLLVEDNPVIAMNTEALLQDLGIPDIQIATTVAEALALVEAEKFEFAILDLRLGDAEDSLPIAAKLVERGISFAFATGFGESFDLAQSHGAVAVLKKPYRFEDLERIVQGRQ